MAQAHKLGWSSGTIYEHDDGTASYRAPGKLLDSFRVRIADVDGFTETRGEKKTLQNTLHIVGLGGDIATCDINAGTTTKIEAWFRAHPDFASSSKSTAPHSGGAGGSVADELAKLAQLRDAGILTPEEFAQQKARLLS